MTKTFKSSKIVSLFTFTSNEFEFGDSVLIKQGMQSTSRFCVKQK